jgi:predicted PurR-regulated permease PerM/methylmalonyl-CoA mutase cobalamin-binding subunit
MPLPSGDAAEATPFKRRGIAERVPVPAATKMNVSKSVETMGGEPESGYLIRTAAAGTIAALVVTTLYVGRPVLMPFALAILLAFALGPIVSALGKIGLPRGPSAVCAVAFSVLIFVGLGTFIAAQFAGLASDLPRYQSNLTTKIETISGSAASSGLLNSTAGVFKVIDNAIARSGEKGNRAISNGRATPLQSSVGPIPVEIKRQDLSSIEVLEDVLSPLLAPLATIAIVVVFVIFILLQKEDLRDRFISLVGARDLQRTTTAIDDAAHRLSRYLLLQTAVNACFGMAISVGLLLIGIPSAGLWGLIGSLLRFVPYVGIPIAAALPLALAFAIDPGWSMLLFTAGLFFSMEAIVGQAVEPWLYGRHMGLSAIAIVLSAGFWTWVWGPVGLLLSTPLTMCIAIIGRNVEQLRFLHTLLGNQAALTPEEDFYLRMLAGSPDEAAEKAEVRLKDMSLSEYFDQVAMRGLALAQIDLDRGVLDLRGRTKICASVDGFIENLSDYEDSAAPSPSVTDSRSQHELQPVPQYPSVLCVAGKGHLDNAATSLLSDLLNRRGITTQVISSETAFPTQIHAINAADVRVICVSYLAPANQTNARYLIRRLRRLAPDAIIVVGFWNAVRDDTQFLDSWESIQCNSIATNLRDAVTQLQGFLNVAP